MRIGWVGGLTRSEAYLAEMAAKEGHELEYHNGDVKGHRAGKLRNLVDRSALVIILTTINSHKGVQLAKQMARKHNCPAIVMQRCGPVAFRKLLAGFDGRNEVTGILNRQTESIYGREQTGFQGTANAFQGGSTPPPASTLNSVKSRQ